MGGRVLLTVLFMAVVVLLDCFVVVFRSCLVCCPNVNPYSSHDVFILSCPGEYLLFLLVFLALYVLFVPFSCVCSCRSGSCRVSLSAVVSGVGVIFLLCLILLVGSCVVCYLIAAARFFTLLSH